VVFRAIAAVVLVSSLLSGCGSEQVSGNRTLTREAVASIRNGVTTRDHIRALLGTPLSVKTQMPIARPPGSQTLPAKLAASEIWAYRISRNSNPGLAKKLMKSEKPRYSSTTVIIYFDGDGVVLDSKVEEEQS